MRRCKFITRIWNKETMQYDVEQFEGNFHEWGHEAQYDSREESVATHTTALVETDDGVMRRAEVENIQFTDTKEGQ